jgi:hypothetical protein
MHNITPSGAYPWSRQQPENCENRNDPDLVQAFLKKWWVESDFKAPSLPLSLRLKYVYIYSQVVRSCCRIVARPISINYTNKGQHITNKIFIMLITPKAIERETTVR